MHFVSRHPQVLSRNVQTAFAVVCKSKTFFDMLDDNICAKADVAKMELQFSPVPYSVQHYSI